jgi:hypothetical protein
MNGGAIDRACASVIYRSYRALDKKEYGKLAQCFHEDAVWFRQGAKLVGHAQILEALHQRPAQRISAHFVSNLEVKGVSADKAEASYLMIAYLRDDQGLNPGAAILPSSVSRYRDHFECKDDRWSIVFRRPSVIF